MLSPCKHVTMIEITSATSISTSNINHQERKKNTFKQLLYKVLIDHCASLSQKPTQFFHSWPLHVHEFWTCTTHLFDESVLPTKIRDKTHQDVDKLVVIQLSILSLDHEVKLVQSTSHLAQPQANMSIAYRGAHNTNYPHKQSHMVISVSIEVIYVRHNLCDIHEIEKML